MTFDNGSDSLMLENGLVGVAVCYTDLDRGYQHVGIVYLDPAAEPAFLHLAFHHKLIKQPPPIEGCYVWAECPWLLGPESRSNAEFLAAFVETCAQNTEIPYGFDPPDDAFDANGSYDGLDPSRGLTCATFVAAVLKCGGFPVADLATWQSRPEDKAWRTEVLRLLRRHAPDQARLMEQETVPFRLRPDEIAASAAAVDVPVNFRRAIALAEPLRRTMEQAFVSAA